MKRYVTEELVPELAGDRIGSQYLVVADAGYYKILTGRDSAEVDLGYVRDCVFGPWKVVYVPSYRAIFYDPIKVRAKIAQGMNALLAHVGGTYEAPGHGIIHFEAYPRTTDEIADWLQRLLAMDCDLSIDIEAFSLRHDRAGIGTITFCWSKHEGIAFPVDYVPIGFECCGGNDQQTHHTVDCSQYPEKAVNEAPFGKQGYNREVRYLLQHFFRMYLKKAIYHNISYDAYILIYQLFMSDVLDVDGMLQGMDIMLRNWDCTQLITYLATNSCAGNNLGLKANAQEFSGNYAVEEIHDITKIPLDKLLRYNLVDGLSTWYVHEKNYPKMVADQQLEIYEQLFKPTILDIIQMQLTGMPLYMPQVQWVKSVLTAIEQDALSRIHSASVVQQFTYWLREQHVLKRNAELKKKRISMGDAEVLAIEFNPNSGPQLQALLYGMLGLPVIDLTDTKQPATGGETLEKLLSHAKSQDVKDFLQAMLDYSAVYKLLSAFIPAFEDAVLGPDGWHYLCGAFRLGGARSGRLASKSPNLQNLPANVEMLISAVFLQLFPGLGRFVKKGKLDLGKLIKSCFQAPPGWIFLGLDFASLEDRISALTTKDPNKLKVYTDGYDGHSLRALAYFGDQMEGIDPNSVASVNSIQDKYKKLRQDSKAPTFALTYQGTWKTLVENSDFSEQLAKQIEAKYHELYQVSDTWVQGKLDEASKCGYITAAFGLRIRTPLLAQVIRGTSRTPHEAEAEGRTAGNALGQSWCLLNERAGVEFMGKVRQSRYRLDVRPCAHIHDAQYYLVREDVGALLFVNDELVKAVQWQEHPEIRHDQVHLGGNVSIFWPDWAHEIEIPNGVGENSLFEAIGKKLERL
jgi:DNA polymerase-1